MPKPTISTNPVADMTFYEFDQPPLEAGNYSVTVTQTAVSTDPAHAIDASYDTTLSFAVLGPRFTLPPNFVHTQFPPPNAQGEYDNVLPHVVFTRKTLPWQRQVSALPPPDDLVYPWLALLVFDYNDPAPPILTGTLEVFQSPPAGTLTYPNLQLDIGETWQDPCRYIDIPASLFYQTAPTQSDVRWLAHARAIDSNATLDKPGGGSDGALPQHEFSVVVGNRLPTPGNQTVCCLVSLENFLSSLPGSRGQGSNGVETVRLAVLLSWTFSAEDLPQTFGQYFANLNDAYTAPITPVVPYANTTGNANTSVENALAMNYTALNHQTRQGAQTVSWYRGPFLSYPNPVDTTLPASSADALVDYDPGTGMLDESLAAAWQIGQLLALNDQQFSTSLFRWKRGQTQEAIVDFETAFLAGRLAVSPALVSRGDKPVVSQLIRSVVKPLLQTFLAARDK